MILDKYNDFIDKLENGIGEVETTDKNIENSSKFNVDI